MERGPVGGREHTTRGLRPFREALYAGLARSKDALFELSDAMLSAGASPSPVHLSLAAVHRRGWVSLYAALSRETIDEDRVQDLLAARETAGAGARVYAVDVSPWPRCDGETSPGRSYLYHPSRHSAGQPIVAG